MSNVVSSSYSNARRAVFGDNQSRSSFSLLNLSYSTLLMFGSFLLIGTVFMILAFLFLPILVISPEKFTVLFTFGGIFWMIGLGTVQGPRAFLNAMIEKPRLTLSIAYLVSVYGVIFSTFLKKSYILTLVFAGLQIASLVMILISYIPGGLRVIRFLREYTISKFRGDSFLPI